MDPREIIAQIQDLLAQLEASLGAEEAPEPAPEMLPQSDQEVAAGIPPRPRVG